MQNKREHHGYPKADSTTVDIYHHYLNHWQMFKNPVSRDSVIWLNGVFVTRTLFILIIVGHLW